MGNRKLVKATNKKITQKFLDQRADRAKSAGFGEAKWITFCRALLSLGLSVTLYEARRTYSKYITVSNGEKSAKIRFSDHRPIKHREISGDCDFFVGITHTGTRTTEDALRYVADVFEIEGAK